jgi:hypothetical protein
MTISAEIQENEEVLQKETVDLTNGSTELAHLAISVKVETAKTEVTQNNSEILLGFNFSEKVKRTGRFAVFLTVVVVLFAGRFSVPDNEVTNVQDKIVTALGFANDFINTPGNEHYRDFFQFFCSLLLDIIFIVTFGHWVLYGKSCRLPATLGIFYITRALVQKVWFSPFPQGFYWESPGIPSLVVPYGRGSDFFFSGHSGFVVICASEWHKLKMPKIRNFIIGTAVYTVLILLIYRIHYSIDVFTGVIFAEWCFIKVDSYKDVLDHYWVHYTSSLRDMVTRKDIHLPLVNSEITPLAVQH